MLVLRQTEVKASRLPITFQRLIFLDITRPGLQKFLQDCSSMYEMHVYTMGTRQYAESVCRIIDPDGKSFANRILSRDESGSTYSSSGFSGNQKKTERR